MATGQMHSYSATLPQKRMVTDRIIMTDPMDIVAISALGLDNMNKFAFVNTPGKTYEWLLDTYSGRSTTMNDATWTSDSTDTSLVVTDGTIFQVGDILKIDAEYVWVSAVSTNTLTVTRDFGGTQATHADSTTVSLVGRNRLEGASASDGHFTEPTTAFNYSAILQKSIEVSRSNALIPMYGIPNVVERQIDKVMAENLHLLNLMVYHGQRKAGSATTPRGFGGLKEQITSNTTAAASAALTRKMIEDELQNCWNEGGKPDLILCGGWAKRKISSFYEGSVRTERSESMGGIEIDVIVDAIGNRVSIAVDRSCPTDELYIIDREQVGLITIDPFFYEDLAKTKDTAAYGQVVGEYGFVFGDEARNAVISGFSTTA